MSMFFEEEIQRAMKRVGRLGLNDFMFQDPRGNQRRSSNNRVSSCNSTKKPCQSCNEKVSFRRQKTNSNNCFTSHNRRNNNRNANVFLNHEQTRSNQPTSHNHRNGKSNMHTQTNRNRCDSCNKPIVWRNNKI